MDADRRAGEMPEMAGGAGGPPRIFVGMVTHERSRFNADGLAARLAAELTGAIAALGVSCELLVSDRDDYDERVYPLTGSVLARSAVHQARLESRWSRYLRVGRNHRPSGLQATGTALYFSGMAAKRLAQLPRDARIAARRLLNIDLSHLRVMDAAIAARADWAVVLEDDAGIDDVTSTAAAIVQLTSTLERTDVSFVNLSESLSLEELDVADLLTEAHDLAAPPGHTLMRARLPITNTVCATLYRAGYLRELCDRIKRHGLVPVAPIDWRVDEVIMDMVAAGELGSGSCLWVRPGLVVQRSMHG